MSKEITVKVSGRIMLNNEAFLVGEVKEFPNIIAVVDTVGGKPRFFKEITEQVEVVDENISS